MTCCISCFVALVFFVANIYLMLTVDCKKTHQKFYDLLDDRQKLIKKNIVEERKSIYFKGYGIGLVLSFIFIYFYKYSKANKKSIINKSINNKSTWFIVCIVGAITFICNYLYYILSPKSTYMIEHLTTSEQIKEWLKIYRTMQIKYHTGLVLGIVAVMVFGYANRC